MSLLVVGLSHHSAPVSLLERVALTSEAAAKLARDVVDADHVNEAVVLSTCNRVEVWADVTKFHGGVSDVSDRLARHTGLAVDGLSPHLYVHYEERAVQHVLAVACGLDSMVVGEQQVLAQLRQALRTAQQAGTVGRLLNALVQQALRVGKRAHTETGIDSAAPSLVSVGLELGAVALDGLAGRRALVVGAGAMSSLAAHSLERLGLGEIVIVNRTFASAQRLAAVVSGRAVRLERLADELAAADVVVSCTGATGLVVTRAVVERAREQRGPAPQFVLDLALPRDVEAGVAEVDGVALVDLERLATTLDGSERAADVEAVSRIVSEETVAFLAWQRASNVAPTVVALRDMAAEVVDGELGRLAGRLPELDDRTRDEVAQTVRRVVDKLLHAPTVRVKQLAEMPGGQTYAAALRELFDLDPRTVEALTTLDAPPGERP